MPEGPEPPLFSRQYEAERQERQKTERSFNCKRHGIEIPESSRTPPPQQVSWMARGIVRFHLLDSRKQFGRRNLVKREPVSCPDHQAGQCHGHSQRRNPQLGGARQLANPGPLCNPYSNRPPRASRQKRQRGQLREHRQSSARPEPGRVLSRRLLIQIWPVMKAAVRNAVNAISVVARPACASTGGRKLKKASAITAVTAPKYLLVHANTTAQATQKNGRIPIARAPASDRIARRNSISPVPPATSKGGLVRVCPAIGFQPGMDLLPPLPATEEDAAVPTRKYLGPATASRTRCARAHRPYG